MSTNDTTAPTVYLGIDIAKDSLQIDTILPGGPALVDNTPASFKRILKRAATWSRKDLINVHVVCEATGGYERGLLDALHQAGVTVSLVQPKRVRDFANAAGILDKTDAIDASVLSRYGTKMEPRITPPPTAVQRELSALVSRRNQLIDTRVAEQNRASGIVLPELRKMTADLLRYINAQIKRIEKMIARLIASDEELSAKVKRLCQLDGVAITTASSILATMPELGTATGRQMASLAGLAPRARDSGKHKGRRTIGGGRAPARRALYMAAMTAARMNEKLSALYQRIVAKGKPKKVALTAVMRQMLNVMNSLLKNPDFALE